MSTLLETNTEKILTLQEQFDPNDFVNKRPTCIKTVGWGITSDRFPQSILSSKRQVKAGFHPLQKDNDHLYIELLAGQMMDDPMLALWALFNLMEVKDPFLNLLKGKNIIIPQKYEPQWIMFQPIGKELLWDISSYPKKDLDGDNAVLIVLKG